MSKSSAQFLSELQNPGPMRLKHEHVKSKLGFVLWAQAWQGPSLNCSRPCRRSFQINKQFHTFKSENISFTKKRKNLRINLIKYKMWQLSTMTQKHSKDEIVFCDLKHPNLSKEALQKIRMNIPKRKKKLISFQIRFLFFRYYNVLYYCHNHKDLLIRIACYFSIYQREAVFCLICMRKPSQTTFIDILYLFKLPLKLA